MTAKSTALLMFLEAQRASVLAIIDGLDAEALTTAVLPSGWTPLGLVEHLGYADITPIRSGMRSPTCVGSSCT